MIRNTVKPSHAPIEASVHGVNDPSEQKRLPTDPSPQIINQTAHSADQPLASAAITINHVSQPSNTSQDAIMSPELEDRTIPKTNQTCPDCHRVVTSERSHRALCSTKTVNCIYKSLTSEDKIEIILHRDGNLLFTCWRCSRRIKKTQGMRVSP